MFQAVDLPDVTPGENLWQYSFSLEGFAFRAGQGFTIFFDTRYGNLAVSNHPANADWDLLMVQPNPPLNTPGYVDGLALVDTPALGQPFDVRFVWRGLGDPGPLPFVIYDTNYATIFAGQTATTNRASPTLACPTNLIADTLPGQCGAAVDFTVVASGSPPPMLSCQPGAGSFFPVGINGVVCNASNELGMASCSFLITVRDTNPPVIVCPSNLTLNTAPGSCTAMVNLAAPVVSDNCGTITLTNNRPGEFTSGSNAVVWLATDLHGNTATCTQWVTVVDAELPVISCPAELSVGTDPGACGATLTLSPPVVMDNCGMAGMTNYAPLFFPSGVTPVRWITTDMSGNTSVCTQQVIVADRELPILICPPDVATNADAGQCVASNVLLGFAAASDNCGAVSVTNNAPAVFPAGLTEVVWTATDAAGNASVCTQRVVVAAEEMVTLQCPSDLTVTNTTGACGALVDYAAPIAIATCGMPLVEQIAGLPGGAFFPVGVTTNVFRATDSAGRTNLCSFTVTVRDITPPAPVCPANVTAPATGPDGAIVDYQAGATDNCSGVMVSCAPASGALFPVGVTTVNCRATDAAGNTNDCSFTVTVTSSSSVTAGLVSHWPFDELVGDAALDSANLNPGLLVNGPTRISDGHLGSALCFDGTNDYVNVPDSDSLDLGDRLTIALWFKPGQAIGPGSPRQDLAQKFLSFWLILGYPESDGRLALVLNTGEPRAKSTNDQWLPDRWYHVAATFDGGNVLLYVNGVLEGADALTATAANTSFPLQIGGNTTQGHYFRGCLDEVRLYHRALGPGEISQLYHQSPNTPPELSGLGDLTTKTNTPTLPQRFTVGDAETPVSNLVVTATSSDLVLVPETNILFAGTGRNRTITLTPALGQSGTAVVHVVVTDLDGASASRSFTLTVLDPSAPASGMVAHWPFDESGGPLALDSAGEHHGLLGQGVTRVNDGAVGAGSLFFNGVNGHVNVPDSPVLDFSNQMTIALWFKPAQLLGPGSGRQDLLKKFRCYWLITSYPEDDGRLVFVLNSGLPRVKSTNNLWLPDRWYHAAATYDGMELRLYINGLLENSALAVVSIFNNSSPVQIGGNTEQSRYFRGCLDDPRLYSRAISAAEVQALAAMGTTDLESLPADWSNPGGSGPSARIGALDGDLMLYWEAVASSRYQVQHTGDIDAPDWQELDGVVTATEPVASVRIVVEPGTQRFFRVLFVP